MRFPRLFSAVPFSALLALARAAPITGQEPVRPEDYFGRNWMVDDGVPHDVVNRAVQDGQGYLWLATAAGLARFDGRSFREFPLPHPSLDSGYNIRALAAEDGATLLMLPARGDVVRLRAGVFSLHPVSAWVHGQSILDLFPEPSGALWLGMADGGLVRWANGRVETFGAAEGIARHGADFSFAIDAAGSTWIAGGNFFARYEKGRLIPFPQPVGTDMLIAPARSGGLWIATRERLLKWEHGILTASSPAPIWPTGQKTGTQQMFEDRDGSLWIATRRRGLYRWAGGQLTHEPTSSQMLTSVTADAEGDIWVTANGGGISELRRKHFVLVDAAAGLPDGTSSAVCADLDGAVWFANRGGGVARYVGGRVELVPPPPGSQPFYANTVYPGADGEVWVGAFDGLYRTTPAPPRRLERVDAPVQDVRVLFRSREGDLWIASPNHLGYMRRGIYHAITAAEGYAGFVPGAIAQDAGGTIWVAVERELFSFADGRLVRRVARESFPGGHIHALAITPDGDFWLGTARGLVGWRGDRLRCFLTADGLADDLITQVLPDGNGSLWLGGRRGLFRVALGELRAVADGRSSAVISTPFGAEEGLAAAAPVSVCQPAVWRAGDGRLWFTTYKGVVGLDPAAASQALPAPPVFLDQTLVDGHPAAAGAGLRMVAGNQRLEFLFSAPSFIAPEKVQLHYRLSGYDADWIDTGSERLARYAWLPAGRYQLQVAARHQDGAWGAPVTMAAITVVPHWWQTPGGRIALLGLFTALVVLLARHSAQRQLKQRLRRLEQEHALEKERTRIARDLHDELGSGLSQIGMLAHRLKRRCREDDLAPGLGQLASRTRRLSSELESIVWTVSPKNDSLDGFAGFVRRFAHDFLQDTDIACAVLGAETIPACRLAPEIQHHLLAVLKEALNNAFKHSGATQITLSLSFRWGVFELAIADNGAGFPLDAAHHSERNGLRNMRTRTAEIGGQLQIASPPAGGTVLVIRVRLTPDLRPAGPVAS
jgi:signal transduction histidine kinase/ligand-binding sensor domain-containing protein